MHQQLHIYEYAESRIILRHAIQGHIIPTVQK